MPANTKYVEYLIVKLYRHSQNGIKPLTLISLSLYLDLSLSLLDNHYFDKLRELIELELSIHGSDMSYLLQLLLLFKRISSSDKTEYAEKLLDTVELVLQRLNKGVTQ